MRTLRILILFCGFSLIYETGGVLRTIAGLYIGGRIDEILYAEAREVANARTQAHACEKREFIPYE